MELINVHELRKEEQTILITQITRCEEIGLVLMGKRGRGNWTRGCGDAQKGNCWCMWDEFLGQAQGT